MSIKGETKQPIETESAHLTSIAFRPNESAEIIGVVIAKPQSLSARPCFQVEFKDGLIDYVAISEWHAGNCTIHS